MKRISFIHWFNIIFIMGYVISVHAQTLTDLIDLIDTQNLHIKALEQMYQASTYRGAQVNELPDPDVSVGLFPYPVETRLGPQQFRIGATQMFPWKGLLDKKEEIEDVKSLLNYENIGAAKLELVYMLKRSYFMLYEKEKAIGILNQNLEIFRVLQNFTLSKVESGMGSTADVLRVELKITAIEKELEILENQKEKPRSVINLILNRPVDSTITIKDSLSFAIIPYVMDTLALKIMADHPVINSMDIEQEIARKTIELNELNSKPSFGVGLDYIVVGKRTDADPVGNGTDIVMPRGSIKIPLYRKKYSAKEQEEKLKIEALENKKLDTRNRYISSIDQAFTDYREAQIEMQLYSELINTTQATLDILETDYSNSGRNFDELLRLQIELVDYDLKILKAIVKSHVAKAEVEKFFF